MIKIAENQSSAALRLAKMEKMYKNKKAMDWMIVVSAAIAVFVLAVTIVFIGKGTSEANTNLGNLQSCKGQKGECKKICLENEIGQFKALGCGSGDFKDKEYCCLPPNYLNDAQK